MSSLEDGTNLPNVFTATVASPNLEGPPLYVINAATMLVMNATLLNRNSKN
ncbi:hypothetical protein [Sutcliffiella horikoshii]|uniref:hypothetical protein n=1 Tax=Sutcliffiella horikoshii TaxID=79883 RepID=UPI0012F76FAE|nr:hypothetical protein [Sutcliffiella horikoshii]